MGEMNDFIKERAAKTINIARQVAVQWTWQKQTVEELETALADITGNTNAGQPMIGQEEITSQLEQAMLAVSGAWDTQLYDLHRRTVHGLTMAKTRHRNNMTNLAVLSGLTARGTSRAETLAEALAWEVTWAKIDPEWSPLTGNTLPTFRVLRKQCAEELQQAYRDARSDYSLEAEKLLVMITELKQNLDAWHAEAAAVFPVGTPQGDLIRSVPATFNPPATKMFPMTLNRSTLSAQIM